MPERISLEEWHGAHGHLERYRWAAGYIRPSDTVLDIACGIGYGAAILECTGANYVGVDREDPEDAFRREGARFLKRDVDEWTPRFKFDVAVCFETLEHVVYPARLAQIVSKARRFVLVSVPTVPTVGINPWHLHDFTEDSLPYLFLDHPIVEMWPQPSERSHVWAFKT